MDDKTGTHTATDIPELKTGERRFIGQMTAFNYFGSLEEADEAWQKVLSCASDHGFELMGGTMSLAREREPVEAIEYGSTAPYRNVRAETTWGAMAGDTSTSRAGSEAHAH